MIKVKDKWAEKYLKDKIYFSLGSLLNAWALIKQGDKNYTLDEFLKDSEQIYLKAKDYTIRTYKIYEELEIQNPNDYSPELPIQ